MAFSLRRITGALALTVFLLRVLAPEVGHACGSMGTMGHDAVANSQTAAITTAADHASGHDHHGASAPSAGVHDQHGSSAVAVADASVEQSSSTPDQHDTPCDCSAWCCCLPTMTRPPTSLITVTATVVTTAEPTAWASTSTPALRVDRLLPFATAPPRA